MEQKFIPLEIKSMDKREIVFAHAVYDNIDNTGDISRKGMFTKSWQENKSNIKFKLNHTTEIGKPIDFWEDEHKAYTRAEFSKDQVGKDAVEMVENRVISSTSFGYIPMRREFKSVMGRKVRELKEVKQTDSSLLTFDNPLGPPANPLTSIISLKADAAQNKLVELDEKIKSLESFCRKTTASDECILSILNQVDELKSIFSLITSTYAVADATPTPGDDKEFADSLYLLTTKL